MYIKNNNNLKYEILIHVCLHPNVVVILVHIILLYIQLVQQYRGNNKLFLGMAFDLKFESRFTYNVR